ncbi:hypothetical protein Scep_008066 [Stephania cephalantha]|uniref:IREH1/IRE-like N-terminal domain-containing protein n=1 Tax=Stephania cephalantha TaxID=152367 RepID=A0AAP0KCX2_9MAGN
MELYSDLVSILEDSIDSHPEWRTRLEDLLIVARECAGMSASDFGKDVKVLFRI